MLSIQYKFSLGKKYSLIVGLGISVYDCGCSSYQLLMLNVRQVRRGLCSQAVYMHESRYIFLKFVSQCSNSSTLLKLSFKASADGLISPGLTLNFLDCSRYTFDQNSSQIIVKCHVNSLKYAHVTYTLSIIHFYMTTLTHIVM